MASTPVLAEVVQKPKIKLHAVPASDFAYNPCLDGLRALAVLAVMGYHLDPPLLAGGNLGVDVFFVLSGFLITGLLLREWTRRSDINLRQFYGRRALRLLPALVSLLLVTELLTLLHYHSPAFWTAQKAIAAALFYSANWMRVADTNSMGPLPHTWSLSIEEQFYLLWPPILLLLLNRIRRKHMFTALLTIIILIWAHRLSVWSGGGTWHRIYNGTDTRIDELLMGCAAAFVFASKWRRDRKYCTLLSYASVPAGILLAAVAWFPVSHGAMCLYGWPMVELSSAIVVSWLALTPCAIFPKMLSTAPLVWLGRISYGVYLWHFPIFLKLEHLPVSGVTKTLVMFTVTFVVAGLSYALIEAPFLRMKSRLREMSGLAHQPSNHRRFATRLSLRRADSAPYV